LWLRVIFKSSVRVSPEMRWLKAFFPRKSYLQYLPAVYQEDDESRLFLDRFLSVFQTDIDNLGNRIATLWQLFDPASADADKLSWLASGIGLYISPTWKPTKLRQMIKDAAVSYRGRGTVAGLEQLIVDYAGVPAKILEHFRLRQWPVLAEDGAALDRGVRLWSRDFYHQLQLSTYSQVGAFQLRSRPAPALEPFDWGSNKFTVFFPADPYNVDATEKEVAQVVEREKPAHTEATLCPVFPRFRVGVQATIGFDTQVGGITNLVLNNLATLNYDSILACSKTEQSIRKAGSALRPETGVTAKLL
jgi:phage tail-like protein